MYFTNFESTKSDSQSDHQSAQQSSSRHEEQPDPQPDHRDLSKTGQIENFRKSAKEVVDYICKYTETASTKPIFPEVEPGFLRHLFPEMPPKEPEEFSKILKDFDEKVMPGMVHWRHPDFYAYSNCGNSLPNVIGDMLSTACGGIVLSWTAQPAGIEMENLIMDWIGRAFGLPEHFLHKESEGKGGGCTEVSASDCIFNVFIAARYTALKSLGCYSRSNSTTMDDPVHPSRFIDKLICYTSLNSHSCVEKAANIAMVEIRILTPNQNHQITGDILEQAILEDKEKGRIPFLFSGVIGSPGLAVSDDHETIGPICQKHNLWFHVDGAYGGNMLLLPELAHLRKGLEYADSFDINSHEMLLGAPDGGCLWLRDVSTFKQPWLIDATYQIDRHERENMDMETRLRSTDYRNYGIPLSRRFRALKMFFVLRMYGLDGLMDYQRHVMNLAKLFESLVRADDRFVVTHPATLGVVLFRQKGAIEKQLNFNHLRSDRPGSYINLLNMNLLYRINKSGKIHICPFVFNGLYHLRVSVNYEFTDEDDIRRAWNVIQSFHVTELDEEWQPERPKKTTAEEKRLQRLKSQLSFVTFTEHRQSSKLRLQQSFGQFSVCVDDEEEEATLFRN